MRINTASSQYFHIQADEYEVELQDNNLDIIGLSSAETFKFLNLRETATVFPPISSN